MGQVPSTQTSLDFCHKLWWPLRLAHMKDLFVTGTRHWGCLPFSQYNWLDQQGPTVVKWNNIFWLNWPIKWNRPFLSLVPEVRKATKQFVEMEQLILVWPVKVDHLKKWFQIFWSHRSKTDFFIDFQPTYRKFWVMGSTQELPTFLGTCDVYHAIPVHHFVQQRQWHTLSVVCFHKQSPPFV